MVKVTHCFEPRTFGGYEVRDVYANKETRSLEATIFDHIQKKEVTIKGYDVHGQNWSLSEAMDLICK